MPRAHAPAVRVEEQRAHADTEAEDAGAADDDDDRVSSGVAQPNVSEGPLDVTMVGLHRRRSRQRPLRRLCDRRCAAGGGRGARDRRVTFDDGE